MSKPDSGLFTNTNGLDDFYGDAESVIAARVVGLDLTPHPTIMKQLSSKQKSKILNKIKNRTATKEEYIRYMWNQRFTKRRKTGVLRFWKEERNRIKRGEKTTRNWSKEQIDTILNKKTPKFNDSSIEGHHTYSAKEFPHLANLGAIIYPATKNEHLKGWHGGSYNKSMPGRRIRKIHEF